MGHGALKRTTRCALWGCALFACIGGVPAAEPQADEPDRDLPPTAQQIERLIEQLDAGQFDVREKAMEELIKIGDAAEPKLAGALSADPSPELKRRGQAILKKIRRNRIARDAVASDDFLVPLKLADQGEFDAAAYEAKLERLIGILRETTDDDSLSLPVRFDQVQANNGRPGISTSRSLFLGDRFSSTSVDNSIILADLAVDVSSARNCIIVARYGVKASSCQNCIVIAGRSVDISILQGGVVLCGGGGYISIAQQSILGAPNLRTGAGTFKEMKFINGGVVDERFQRPNQPPSRRYDTPAVVISPPPSAAPLGDKIRVTFSQPPGRTEENGFVLVERAGQPGEFVVRNGNGLKNPDGQALPGLEGWTLRHSAVTFAVFSDGKRESCLDVLRR